MTLEEKAREYAVEVWGAHVNNYCDHELSEMTLGEISEKDFIEGYKAGLGDASFNQTQLQRKIDIALKALEEINDISNDMQVLSKIDKALKKIQSLPKITL